MRIGWLVLFCALTGSCGEAPPRRAENVARPVIVEERDGLWLRDSAGVSRRLTALRVAGFDFDSLAARQREGVVILYWAAAPTLSPDWRTVAYATNREAVAADTAGQSIWLLSLSDGSERALLHRPGRSYRPVGWLADEVVYIGDEPGVHAVDTVSGETRLLAHGTWIAVADDGSALAVADGLPDSARLSVLTRNEIVPLPAAPAGFQYLPDASFVEGGRALLLEAAADSGRTRRFLAFAIPERRLMPLNPDLESAGRVLPAGAAAAALEGSLGAEAQGGRTFCSWVELGADADAIYVWALCQHWVVGSDSLEVRAGRSLPLALLVAAADDALEVSEVRAPRDGALHDDDLRAVFPSHVRSRLPERDAVAVLEAVNRLQARRCFERSSVQCIEPRA